MSGGRGGTGRAAARDRAAVVGLVAVDRGHDAAEGSLDELARLAVAAGASPSLRLLQERRTPDPALFLGLGKVESLAAGCAELGLDLVIVDNELSPAQLRNLERALDCRVIDRTQLILDIFARRARSHEGKLQVELAQLRYLLPRLAGAGVALSRLGGGIGTRGPGETKLETDRRTIRRRIEALGREIETVRRRRRQLRDRHHRRAAPTVALVGYTNAGKTTLFNRLTRTRAPTSDALFVTLDPLVRQIALPDGRRLLLSDTVGFIDRLPHALVAAFRATLEEVAEADLLLHVVDASSEARERQAAAVRRVLAEVGAEAVPAVTVLNKCDRIDAADRARLARAEPGGLLVSARTGDGEPRLVADVTRRLSLDTRRVRIEMNRASSVDRRRIRQLYRHARVLRHEEREDRVEIEAEVPRRMLERLQLSREVG